MKNITALLFILILMSSCEDYVKWEFMNSPTIKERGAFTSAGLNIHKLVTKSDINKKLGLESTAELKQLQILNASITIDVDTKTAQADSLKFELFCDAIPFEPTHRGTVAIPKGVTADNLLGKKISLGGVSLEATTILNNVLQGLITSGNATKFSLVGRTIPSGSTITCDVLLYIDFYAVYWECVKKPEYMIFYEQSKGLCN